MKYKNVAALALVGILSYVGVRVAYAEEAAAAKVDYTAEIKKHAEEGIAHGKQGHMDILEQHAREALKSAKLGMEHSTGDKMAFRMEISANHLRKAIKQAKEGQTDAAIKHLQEVITVLTTEPPVDKTQP